ncbi:MAG TPA: hypothetical protein VNS09_27510 [Solirubrobacter sp.]|nr:hypothetical protein [Solirubrobacter sp.]
MNRRWPTIAAVCLAAGFAAGTGPAPTAYAGTVRCLAYSTFDLDTPEGNAAANSVGWMRFIGAPGETNRVTATGRADNGWVLWDAGAPLRIGAPGKRERKCSRSSKRVSAPKSAYKTRIVLEGRDGNDELTADVRRTRQTASGALRGGDGDDRLVATLGRMEVGLFVVNGDAGDDDITFRWPYRFDHPFRSCPHWPDGTPAPGRCATLRRPQSVRIHGGSGDDRISIGAWNGGDATPQRLAARPSLPGFTMKVSGGAGDDVIILHAAGDRARNRADQAEVDCGPGRDTLDLDGGPAPVSVKRCETIINAA